MGDLNVNYNINNIRIMQVMVLNDSDKYFHKRKKEQKSEKITAE